MRCVIRSKWEMWAPGDRLLQILYAPPLLLPPVPWSGRGGGVGKDLACSRCSDSRARRQVGSELSCTHRKNGGGGNRGARARVLSPFPPLVSPRFFIFVNFSPALCYLNAWNRLERTLVTRLVCAELACSGSSILRQRKHEKKIKNAPLFPDHVLIFSCAFHFRVIHTIQERIKRTEKASSIHTLFHR